MEDDMSKNIITIDIDSERDEPIKINKPEEYLKGLEDFDELIKKDLSDISLTILYMCSMLNEEDENRTLMQIKKIINERLDEIN